VTVEKVVPIEIADPFARKLVGQYLQNREGDIGKLQDALRRDDFETIGVTGHNLYGSGSAYGLDEVSRIGANLEKAAEQHDGAGVARLVKELAEFLRTVEVT
jgi:HPt (histidine-containing phosphotransfer) domain-containing protein